MRLTIEDLKLERKALKNDVRGLNKKIAHLESLVETLTTDNARMSQQLQERKHDILSM